MFDKEQVNQYRQMTVPADWESEILGAASQQKRNRRPIVVISAIAACLVLTMIGAAVIRAYTATPSSSVSLPAVTISEPQISSVAIARADSVPYARFTLTADGDIHLTAHSNTLFVIDGDHRSPLTDATFQNSVTLEWEITTEPTVFSANAREYTLVVDDQIGNISIR